MKNIIWQTTRNYHLDQQHIHVWFLDINLFTTEAEELIGFLDEKERKRADRFRFEKDRVRFIVSHGKLRQLLSDYLGSDPADIVFQHNLYGKPHITVNGEQSALTFNLSHRHDRALIAITKNDAVGVDIERIDDKALLDDIVNRFFSKEEQEEYRSLSEDQKREGFYLAWTRKESFIKALGKGMMYALHNFSVNLTPDEQPRVISINDGSSDAADWQMHSFVPEEGYCSALCWKGLFKEVLFFKF